MIYKEIHQHFRDYAVLIAVSVIAAIIYISPSVSLALKDVLSFLLGFGYAAWGIWHHRHDRSFSVKIALEYVAYGAVVTLILWMSLGY